jgi:hypothetical protein
MTERKKPSSHQKAILLTVENGYYMDSDGNIIDSERVSFDHIIPVSKGGTNDTFNYQHMDLQKNLEKGAGADPAWSKPSFFDQDIQLENLRQSQLSLYKKVVSREYSEFLNDRREEAIKILNLVCQITGAGKSMAKYILPFALNKSINLTNPGGPRIRKVLIIVKDRGIRDQLARDLAADPVALKISSVPPRVGVPKDPSQLCDARWVERFDFVVICVQSLWGSSDDATKTDVRMAMFGHFQLIEVDEPHFATQKIQVLKDLAFRSLFFGFTGSPINADGEILQRLVLFELFDYNRAVSEDFCLKHLPDPDEREELFTMIEPDELHLQRGGDKHKTADLNSVEGYASNITPQLSVMVEVINHMRDVDIEMVHSQHVAPHRQFHYETGLLDYSSTEEGVHKPIRHLHSARIREVKIGACFPAHAIIVVGSIDEGKRMAQEANRYMEIHRGTFPAEKGYYADFVSGEDGLSPEHSWYRSDYDKDFSFKGRKTRVLVLCGLGREGINNPMQTIVGIAAPSMSVVEHVQRSIGRSIRGKQILKDGVLFVPPSCLDQVKIFLHPAFDCRTALIKAAQFCLNMPAYLEGLPTIEDVMSRSAMLPSEMEKQDTGIESLVTPRERREIFEAIHSEIRAGRDFEEARVQIENRYKYEAPGKKKNIADFLENYEKSPEKALRTFTAPRNMQLSRIDVVLEESACAAVSDEKIITFMRRSHNDLCSFDEKTVLAFGRALYAAEYKKPPAPPLFCEGNIEDIKAGIRKQYRQNSFIRGSFLLEVDGRPIHGELNRLVNVACKQVFGAGPDDVVGNNTIFDTPQHHHILRQERIRRDIFLWIERQLNDKGYFPNRRI